MAYQPDHAHGNGSVPSQAVSTEQTSGYSLKTFFAAIVGLVIIAWNKSEWSICFGVFLTFAGLLAPFYKYKLRNVMQRVAEYRKLQLASEETAPQPIPINSMMVQPKS